ncbi:MAG: RNA-splicing ligase RtcB [Candidatus Aenigmatarchaeota archaeon]|nr:MAG: RNA-splicing ligase RtcB [Candidatus Aenigmarchaeota archaeon]
MKEKLRQVGDFVWELPKGSRERMEVSARIIGSNAIIDQVEDDAVQQLTNVATLPGVVGPVCGLSDMHWGYGLPMGAVGAFDAEEGIISAGLCGFDINCGINSIRTNLSAEEIESNKKELIQTLFNKVPVGVGSKGKLVLTDEQLDDVMRRGINWAIENGYGTKEDAARMEEHGCMEGADPSKVSDLAKKRGRSQLGTLGAGNHFLEVQKVSDIYDKGFADRLGIKDTNQVMIMIHCGSRGLGHQIATDYLKIQEQAVKKYGIWLPDPQLACAPVGSSEGKDFFSAMKCAVNYSFTNRLVMTQWIREAFEQVFKKSWEDMDINTVYGLCHNVIKLEEHTVNGEKRKLYVHRKGATRAFPDDPAIIAGTMGTSSYILKGTEKSMGMTFGSTCHGAGRRMSRHAAIKKFWGGKVKEELANMGIEAQSPHPKSLAEEAPGAYKNVDDVIESVHGAGISLKAVRMVPVGVIKG